MGTRCAAPCHARAAPTEAKGAAGRTLRQGTRQTSSGDTGRTILGMATRTIHLPESSYALLSAEAQRRGVDPDALADELVRADLAAHGEQDIETTLKSLAEFRARLPEIDGIVLARDARTQLEHRSDS